MLPKLNTFGAILAATGRRLGHGDGLIIAIGKHYRLRFQLGVEDCSERLAAVIAVKFNSCWHLNST
ncbi:hypothetical protein D3C73_1611620 [compost metagenome]